MRRTITALLAFGALTAPALAADTVSIAPIQFGPELTEKAEEYGQRELDYLAEQLREDLEREVGHDHGVRDTKNVVGVARAVEGERDASQPPAAAAPTLP